MADGTSKSVEDVRVGDWVKSYDPLTRAIIEARVTDTQAHSPELSADGIVLVNELVAATTNHPFDVEGRAVRADALRVGDHILRLSPAGGWQQDVVRTVRVVPGTVPTFNLSVGAPANYFADSVLVQIKPL
jgi:hypothetical protein